MIDERLRDEFAMAALSGLVFNSWRDGYAEWAATQAYLIADACLKEKAATTRIIVPDDPCDSPQ